MILLNVLKTNLNNNILYVTTSRRHHHCNNKKINSFYMIYKLQIYYQTMTINKFFILVCK